MKNPPKNPLDKKTQTGIKNRYLIEAHRSGFDTIEEYIDALKSEITRLREGKGV